MGRPVKEKKRSGKLTLRAKAIGQANICNSWFYYAATYAMADHRGLSRVKGLWRTSAVPLWVLLLLFGETRAIFVNSFPSGLAVTPFQR